MRTMWCDINWTEIEIETERNHSIGNAFTLSYHIVIKSKISDNPMKARKSRKQFLIFFLWRYMYAMRNQKWKIKNILINSGVAMKWFFFNYHYYFISYPIIFWPYLVYFPSLTITVPMRSLFCFVLLSVVLFSSFSVA